MMASGKSSPVKSTRKMEMPSMPRYQCTPRLLPVYSWFDTSWKPPSCTFMVMRAKTAIRAVTSETIRATT